MYAHRLRLPSDRFNRSPDPSNIQLLLILWFGRTTRTASNGSICQNALVCCLFLVPESQQHALPLHYPGQALEQLDGSLGCPVLRVYNENAPEVFGEPEIHLIPYARPLVQRFDYQTQVRFWEHMSKFLVNARGLNALHVSVVVK